MCLYVIFCVCTLSSVSVRYLLCLYVVFCVCTLSSVSVRYLLCLYVVFCVCTLSSVSVRYLLCLYVIFCVTVVKLPVYVLVIIRLTSRNPSFTEHLPVHCRVKLNCSCSLTESNVELKYTRKFTLLL